jgi:rubrerythrin
MKKTFAFSIVALALAWFPACTPTTNAGGELQKPIAAQATAEQGEEANENEANERENRSGESAENADNDDRRQAASTSANSGNEVSKDLLAAYEGETTASAKYAAYSKTAEAEGLHQVAMLFKATSTSENIHANNHKAVLEDMGVAIPTVKPQFQVGTTAQNLQDAIKGESYEVATMYPEFITHADAAQNQLALVSLNYAYKTEIKHKSLYEKALTAVENKTSASLPTVYYVCPTCGNTYDATPPKRCGISMTNSEKFIKIINLNS